MWADVLYTYIVYAWLINNKIYAYPGFRDNRSTLNTKTGYKKMAMMADMV